MSDWQWLAKNIFKVINEMETEEEITNFIICKIQSLLAHTSASRSTEEMADTSSFKVVVNKFREKFQMPEEEKLVNYYSCRYDIPISLIYQSAN
jgi:6-pyruvoyl-tetrahydropterin synthase